MNTIRETTFNHYALSHSWMVKRAILAATKGHNDANHMYGDASYTIHLAHVVDVAYRFIHLVDIEDRPVVIAACWLHDSIEDARMSYNDVVKATDSRVAELVRAVTNYTRGRNRKERMPDFIYEEIRDLKNATFVKLCDRIANIESEGKIDMYKKENPHFRTMLYNEKYEVMFDYIEYIFTMKTE
jgi:(p)ppGpp synthase/HD superfamily hydrolase